MLGRGLFLVVPSSPLDYLALLERSPLSLGDRLIFLSAWKEDFDPATFDEVSQTPRFPVQISFPGLLPHFRCKGVLQQFGGIFGTPFLSSLSIDSPVPYLKVAAPPNQVFPQEINFEWGDKVYLQKIVVTGRPNQCLQCNVMGHVVKNCPKPLRFLLKKRKKKENSSSQVRKFQGSQNSKMEGSQSPHPLQQHSGRF